MNETEAWSRYRAVHEKQVAAFEQEAAAVRKVTAELEQLPQGGAPSEAIRKELISAVQRRKAAVEEFEKTLKLLQEAGYDFSRP